MPKLRFRAVVSLLVLASGDTPAAYAGTTPTRTEDQILLWDAPTPLPAGSNFGATLAVLDGVNGSSFALIGAPLSKAAQLFALGPDDTVWSSQSFVPPNGYTSQYLPISLDFHPIYAQLDPGGATSSIRRADTGQVLISGIDSGWIWGLAVSGTTLAFSQPDYFGGSGRVRIYEDTGSGGWVHAKTFVGSFPSGLGWGLAIDGPVIVAGAPFSGDNGRVHVYVRTTAAGWFELQEIPSPASGQTGADFGWAVALDGDLLAIGSPNLDRNTPPPARTDAGAVYVYEVVTLPFIEFELQALLRPPTVSNFDRFGTSVDLAQSSTSLVELVAGAPQEDSGVVDGGAVYRYLRTSEPDATSWHLVSRLAKSQSQDIDKLGESVALSRQGVLAGAPYHNGGPLPDLPGQVLFFDHRLFADGFESGDLSAWELVFP